MDQESEDSGGNFIVLFVVVLVILLFFAAGYQMLTRRSGVTGKSTAILQAEAEVEALESSLIRYRTHGGAYPAEQQGLEALVTKPTTKPRPKSWKQYMEASGLTDPWGRPYQYRYPGTRNPDHYDVWSAGPDGIDGTTDDIEN